MTLTRDQETGRLHYQAAPWAPRYDQTIPEMSGLMSRARAELGKELHYEARRTMVRDRIARRAQAAHEAMFPEPYLGRIDARWGDVPANIDTSTGGRSAAVSRRMARLAGVDVRGQYRSLLDPEPTEHKGRGPSPRLVEAWTLAREADDILIADEVGRSLAGERFNTTVETVDAFGRNVAYNVDTRPTVQMSAHTDVWDRAHRRMTIRVDRVAFRGVVRFKRPQPCRYVDPSKARRSLVEWARVATVDALEHAADYAALGAPVAWHAPFTVTHLVTRITAEGRPTRVLHGAPGMGGSVLSTGTRETVDTARSVRATRVGTKRGIKSDPWTTNARQLPRSVRNADVEHIVARHMATLAAAEPGSIVPLAPGHDVIVTRRMDNRGRHVPVIVDDNDRRMSPNEYAQRAALAGIA